MSISFVFFRVLSWPFVLRVRTTRGTNERRHVSLIQAGGHANLSAVDVKKVTPIVAAAR
jgi:hypothetical protein